MQHIGSNVCAPFQVATLWLAILVAGCAASGSSGNEGAGGEGGSSSAGGSVGSGGVVGSGGTTSTSGKGGTMGALGGVAGGTGGSGGAASGGGSGQGGSAGATNTGGHQGTGGTVGTGGSSGGKGTGGTAGAPSGGARGTGGATATGGTIGGGGATATGGTSGTGGASGSAGPCDIYQAAGTPCVAAHSTVRGLYAAYSGKLYQLRRASDNATKDVPALTAGGYADISVQNTFCSGTTCTISILYDQSPNRNDLVKSPVAHWLPNGGTEANAASGQITVNGHTVHGIYVTGYSTNVAYRNNATTGVPKGDQPEAMYMVVDGKRYSNQCCFDYGNAETTGVDDGNGTMEAVYWGSDTTWGGQGEGNGPWIAADLENGMFKSNQGGWQTTSTSPNDKSVIANFATAMLKGPSGNHFTLKASDAQSGTLTTMWDGTRPSPGYSPKKLEGSIILGTGGDGSNGGTGTFFEGAMTNGNPSDATDDAIQANIVAAGYGH